MDAVSTSGRTWVLGGLLLLIGGATWILNTPSLFYEPLLPWPRVLTPVLLVIGLVGGFLRRKPLLYVGWAGVVLFLLIVFYTSIPGEDFLLGGPNPPNQVSGGYVLARLLCLLVLGIGLVVLFRKLGKTLGTKGVPTTPQA